MSDLKVLLERADRAVSGVPLPAGGLEAIKRRQDRRRRHQRIVSASVGVAICIVTIWVVTSASLVLRGRPAVDPGPTRGRGVEQDFTGIPPEGAAPSRPVEGRLVASARGYQGQVFVYADGRLISWSDGSPSWYSGPRGVGGWAEQRLTAEGVKLVRSGAVRPRDLLCARRIWDDVDVCRADREMPTNAWADVQLRQYVPASYWTCVEGGKGISNAAAVRALPAAVTGLLQEGERMSVDMGQCFEVSTDDARALDALLTDAGYFWRTRGAAYVRVSLRVAPAANPGVRLSVSLYPVLPHGVAVDDAGIWGL